MISEDPRIQRMGKLSRDRTWADPDLSLGFMQRAFEREVAKPLKQLGDLGEIWGELVPVELVEHTRLERMQRGVLMVVVDSASRHYELDRLLRSGLEQELIRRHKGTLRRVRVRVGTV